MSVDPAGPQATDTAVRRDPRRIWAAARGPLVIAALIVATAVLVTAFGDRTNRASLDPASVDEYGSRALAQLLRAQGVQVDLARRAADVAGAGPDATVLVPFPELLSASQVEAVRVAGSDVVLLAPDQDVLDRLAPGVLEAGSTRVDTLDPACSVPAAQAAGAAELGGTLYTGPAGSAACYPAPGGATLVQVSGFRRSVTVLGTDTPLTNQALADQGNAALTMRLLGAHPRLVWFLAAPEGVPVDRQRSFTQLVPPGWRWGALTLLVAVALAIGWRARRLGPVVTEPLPVAVRAAEAVEGRALLYRRARARGHAVDVLRRASRDRLRSLVGLPADTGEAELVAVVAARTGRPAPEVEALLYGPAPADDAAMIDVAVALDGCEKEVRRS